MNITHLEHSVFAVVIQCALAAFFGWGAAGAIALAVFIGREYAQVEYKIKRKEGNIPLMPWDVLKPSLWSKDAILDVLSPAVCVGLLSIIMS